MNKNFQAFPNAGTLIGIIVTLVILLTFGVVNYTSAQSKADLCKKYASSGWAYNCCMTHNSNNFDECFNSGSSQKSSSSSSNKTSAPQQSAPQSSGLYKTSEGEAAYQAYYNCLIKNDNNVDICDNDAKYNKVKNDTQAKYDKCQNDCGQDTQCLTGCDKYKKALDEIANSKADAGFTTGKHPNHNSDSNSDSNRPTLAHDFTEEFQSLAGGLSRPFDEIYWKARPFFTNTIVSDSSGPTDTIGNLQSEGWKKASPITTQVPLADVQSGDTLATKMPDGLPLSRMVFAAYDPIKYAKSEITIYNGATTPEILRQTNGPLSNDDVQKPDPKKYDIGFYFRVGTVEQTKDEEIHPFAGALFEILPWMTFDSPQYIRNLRVIRWNKSQQRWDELPIATEQGCDSNKDCRVFAKSPGTSYFAVVAAKNTSQISAFLYIIIGIVAMPFLALLIFGLITLKKRMPARKKASKMNADKKRGIVTGMLTCFIIVVIFIIALGSFSYIIVKEYKNQVKTESKPQTADQPNQNKPNLDLLETEPYANTQYGFKINPPKGWTTNKSPKSGAMVAFLNPKIDENIFHANINIGGESTQLDMDSYMDANKKAITKMDPSYKLIDDEKLTIGGIPAELIGGTSKQGKLNLRTMQLFLIKNGKAAVVTGTTLESTWEEYKDAIKNSLLTFAFN